MGRLTRSWYTQAGWQQQEWQTAGRQERWGDDLQSRHLNPDIECKSTCISPETTPAPSFTPDEALRVVLSYFALSVFHSSACVPQGQELSFRENSYKLKQNLILSETAKASGPWKPTECGWQTWQELLQCRDFLSPFRLEDTLQFSIGPTTPHCGPMRRCLKVHGKQN